MRFFLPILVLAALAVPGTSFGFDFALRKAAVQTLVDTDAGRKSSGKVTISGQDVRDYLIQSSVNWQAYAVTHQADREPPGGVFKIILGPYKFIDLRARWWKRLPLRSTEFRRAELWTRPLTSNSTRYVEMLMRERIDDISFEVRMTFSSAEGAVDSMLKKYRNLLANARRNKLFEGGLTGPAVVAAQTESPSNKVEIAKPFDYSGTWKGPMRNSKGGKVSSSSLYLKVLPDNKVTGSWHAGWKITNGRRNGNVITWSHKRVSKGCRDYDAKLVIEPGGEVGLLTYQVTDRCSKPSKYTGTHRLKKN